MKAQAIASPLKALFSLNYIEVLKPKETSLITFIGAGAALLAGGAQPPWERILLAVAAIAAGVGGSNALTNYLDRRVDAVMQRTQHRALPSGRFHPPELAIPWGLAWVTVSLALAWRLNPWAFLVGLVAVVASLVGRKTVVTHFLGSLAGISPVLIGWLAVAPPQPLLVALALLILVWQPLHVWSLMLAHREDYLGAGIGYFPLNVATSTAIKVLLGLSLSVYLLSWLVYVVGDWGLAYLLSANLLGGGLVLATYHWLRHPQAPQARRLFKLATFPYVGILFLVMILELWI